MAEKRWKKRQVSPYSIPTYYLSLYRRIDGGYIFQKNAQAGLYFGGRVARSDCAKCVSFFRRHAATRIHNRTGEGENDLSHIAIFWFLVDSIYAAVKVGSRDTFICFSF